MAEFAAYIPAALSIGSTLMNSSAAASAAGSSKLEGQLARRQGQLKQAAENREADYMEISAGQQVAASQRDMFDVMRVAKLAGSRVQALSAASGGGATAPTIVKLIGNIAKEGAYNGLRALYSGEEKARTMLLGAFEKRQEGKMAAEAGEYAGVAADTRATGQQRSGIGSLISGAGSLFSKYGGGGPDIAPVGEAVAGQFSLGNPAYG